MAMQDERGETKIDQPGPLHNADGTFACPGYATSLLLEYHRKNVKASAWRIKEWDYYLVNDDEYAVALTLSDMGYAGLVSVSLIDFAQAAYKTTSAITPFPFGRFHLPESSASGVSSFENSRVALSFEAADGQRRLRATFRRFDGDEDLTFEALLDEEPRDTMVIATPWAEDELAFYYNQKIVAMQVRGSFKKGTLVHGFRPENWSDFWIGAAACGRATTPGSGPSAKVGSTVRFMSGGRRTPAFPGLRKPAGAIGSA